MNLALRFARKQVTPMLVLSIVKNVTAVIASLLELPQPLLRTAAWHVSVLFYCKNSRPVLLFISGGRTSNWAVLWVVPLVFNFNGVSAGTGNATEACGGPSRLNLFWSGTSGPQSNPGVGLWKFSGCYA